MSRRLVFLAFVLFCAAWWAVFVNFWAFVVLLIAAMLLGIVAGYCDRAAGDCGYADTPFGHGPHPAAAPVVDLNSRRPVWPNEIGSIE